jgi:hypothetical protein
MIVDRLNRRLRVGLGLAGLVCVVALFLVARAPTAQETTASAAASIAGLQARLADLDPQVRHLKDRRDIFDVSKRYTRGADRHDKDLVRSAFWPEATISFGTPMSREEYVEWEEGVLAGYAAHQHHVTGQTVEVDADTAHVESYVIYFLVPRDRTADEVGPATLGRAATTEKTHLGSGRYVERWERRGGEWKILVREYVEDLSLKGETEDLCTDGRCLGSWDKSDLSYIRPLQHVTPEQRRALGDANRQPRNPQGKVNGAGR